MNAFADVVHDEQTQVSISLVKRDDNGIGDAVSYPTLDEVLRSNIDTSVVDAKEKQASNPLEALKMLFSTQRDKMKLDDTGREILVKKTYVDKDMVGDHPTYNEALGNASDDNSPAQQILATAFDNAALYDVGDDTYYVAFIDRGTLNSDLSASDAMFAVNNNDGITIDNAIYDSDSGIAYIPKRSVINAAGNDNVDWSIPVQAQLVVSMDASRLDDKTTTNVQIESYTLLSNKKRFSIETYMIDTSISIPLSDVTDAKNIRAEDLSVRIDEGDWCSVRGGSKLSFDEKTQKLYVHVSDPSQVLEIDVRVAAAAYSAERADADVTYGRFAANDATLTLPGVIYKNTDFGGVGTWFTYDGMIQNGGTTGGKGTPPDDEGWQNSRWTYINTGHGSDSVAGTSIAIDAYRYLADYWNGEDGIPMGDSCLWTILDTNFNYWDNSISAVYTIPGCISNHPHGRDDIDLSAEGLSGISSYWNGSSLPSYRYVGGMCTHITIASRPETNVWAWSNAMSPNGIGYAAKDVPVRATLGCRVVHKYDDGTVLLGLLAPGVGGMTAQAAYCYIRVQTASEKGYLKVNKALRTKNLAGSRDKLGMNAADRTNQKSVYNYFFGADKQSDLISIEGATYGVFTSADDARNNVNQVTEITTNGYSGGNPVRSTGTSSPLNIKDGSGNTITYYVKEMRASSGCALNTNVYGPYTLQANEVKDITTEDPREDSTGAIAWEGVSCGQLAIIKKAVNVAANYNADHSSGDADDVVYGVYYAGEYGVMDPNNPPAFDSSKRVCSFDQAVNSKGEVIHRMVSGDDGKALSWYSMKVSPVLPVAWYYVKEDKAPDNYVEVDEPKLTLVQEKTDPQFVYLDTDTCPMPAHNNTKVTYQHMVDEHIMGGSPYDASVTYYVPGEKANFGVGQASIEVQKHDKGSGSTIPYGDATYEGIEIGVKNVSGNTVTYKQVDYANGDQITSVTLPRDGKVRITNLPVGKYELSELRGNKWYKIDPTWRKTISVTQDQVDSKAIIKLDANNPYDDAYTTSITVKKTDASNPNGTPTGDADFNGVKFDVFNDGTNAITYNGKQVAHGDYVDTLSVDDKGALLPDSRNKQFPHGKYTIKESATNDYYTLNGNAITVRIDSSGTVRVDSSSTSPVISDNIKTGSASFRKADSSTGSNPQGNASFAGCKVKIFNISKNVIYDSTRREYPTYKDSISSLRTSKNATYVDEVTFDDNGNAKTSVPLPIGTYYAIESAGNEYYSVNDTWSATFSVTADNLNPSPESPAFTEKLTVKNTVHTGSIAIEKVDANTGKRAANTSGIKFTVYNNSKNPVVIDGTTYEPATTEQINNGSAKGFVMALDDNGYSEKIGIPIGSYIAKETETNGNYYLNESWRGTFNITKDNCTSKQFVSMSNKNVTGSWEIQKYDDDLMSSAGSSQGNADFSGIEVSLYNLSGTSKEAIEQAIKNANGDSNKMPKAVQTLTLDKNGYAKAPDNSLSVGKYLVKETKSNSHYAINNDWSCTFEISKNSTFHSCNHGSNSLSDDIYRGGFHLKKYDYDLKRNTTQGNANFAGILVAVKNISNKPVVVNGKTYAVNEDIYSVEKGNACVLSSDGSLVVNAQFPIGTYEVREEKGNAFYNINREWRGVFHVADNGMVYPKDGPFELDDSVKHGGFEIQKFDSMTGKSVPQGDASFKGVTFEIRNASANPVVVEGKEVQPNGVVKRVTLPDNGYYKSDLQLLPLGKYHITEIKGSDDGYYANTSWSQEFEVKENAYTSLTDVIKAPKDQIFLGGVKVQKFSSETVKSGGSDSGLSAIKIDGTDAFINELVMATRGTVTADELMKSVSSIDDMHNDNSLTGQQSAARYADAQIAVINASKNSVQVNGKEIQRNEIAATLTLDKFGRAETNNNVLPYGTYVLKEIKAPEGYKLNEKWSKTIQIRSDKQVIDITGITDAVTDDVIRGDYNLLKIDASDDKALIGVPFLLINTDTGENHVVTTDENGILDTSVGYRDRIETNSDNTGAGDSGNNDSSGVQNDETKIVNYDNSHAYKTNANDQALYTLPDGRYEIDNNKVIHGAGCWFTGYGPLNDPTGELAKRVATDDSNGALPYGHYKLIELTNDATNFDYVLTEDEFTISEDNKIVGRGEALENEHEWHKIHTTAIDNESEDHYGSVEHDDTITISDTVKYEGLRTYKKYTMTGMLMCRETGEPIRDENGDPIIATTEFDTNDGETSGVVVMTFEVPYELVAGKTTVAFETVDYNGLELATHADIDDEGQTVNYPKLHTTATDKSTGEHESLDDSTSDITIQDVVHYSGLYPGREYTVSGVLMDKSTGKPLDGTEPQTVKFVADESEGDVIVEFTVKAGKLVGKTAVAFETLSNSERELFVHADINDEDQTVSFPEIATTALDKEDGDHVVTTGKAATIVDTVRYKNLIDGNTYTMRGTVMDKKTGAPFVDANGNEVVSEQQFIANGTDGMIDIEFTFDIPKGYDSSLVVFEECTSIHGDDSNPDYGNQYPVATHEDFTDRGQTIDLDTPKESENMIMTGDTNRLFIAAGTMIILSLSLISTMIVRRKSKKTI